MTLDGSTDRLPKVALVGVGAVGGTAAAVLEHAGRCELTLIARGRTLAAIQEHGLLVQTPYLGEGAEYRCWPRVVPIDDVGSAVGVQDIVFCCTKAHQLPPLLDGLLPLLGQHTCLVPVMNGIPYWHSYYGEHARGADQPVLAVDPGGRLHASLGCARALGCVVRIGGRAVQPGVVLSAMPPALEFGEPAGAPDSARLQAVIRLFDPLPSRGSPPIPFRATIQPVSGWGERGDNSIRVDLLPCI